MTIHTHTSNSRPPYKGELKVIQHELNQHELQNLKGKRVVVEVVLRASPILGVGVSFVNAKGVLENTIDPNHWSVTDEGDGGRAKFSTRDVHYVTVPKSGNPEGIITLRVNN